MDISRFDRRVICELRRQLPCASLSDEELLCATKDSFLRARIELRLTWIDFVSAIRKSFLWKR